MAAISQLTANFEGTAGTTPANAAAIGATSLSTTGVVTFDAADPKEGNTDLKMVMSTSLIETAKWDLSSTVTTLWNVFYMKIEVANTAAFTVAQWNDSTLTTVVGALRLNADQTLTLRDASTAVWTSPSALPLNQWVRIAVKAVPGSSTGHRCKVYTSLAGNATTADMDSGNQQCTNAGAANIGRWQLGTVTGAAVTLHFDRMRGDDATEPAGITAGNPPVVSAGPDLTKEVGSGSFTITATETPASGTTITARSWSILSGNNVTLSGQTTATVTVTAPTSTTGSTVLRYTATASDSQSTTDDVTLTWVAAGQTFFPVADVSNSGAWVTQAGGSSSLFATIDDTTLNTADYITSPQLSASAVTCRFRLTSRTAPTNTTGWYLSFNGSVTADVLTEAVVIKLYESDGTTLRKTFATQTALTTTDTEYQLTLTSGEVAAITSWASGLIVEISATGT